MKHLGKSPAIALIIVASMLSNGAYAKKADIVQDKFVDCNAPDADLQHAVDTAKGPAVITIAGVCTGDLTISNDAITITGQNPGRVDGIAGQVLVQGVQRIQLNNLTITGGASGIIAFDGAALRAEEVTVSATTSVRGFGVGSFNGSTVILTDAEISGNTGRGVLANANATVEVRGASSISNNGRDGFGIFKASTLTLGSSGDVSGELIEVKDNGGRGINVGENSAVEIREKTTISLNTLHGISAFGGASVFIGGATILGGDSHAITATQSRVFIAKRNGVAPVIDGGSNGKGLTLAFGASAEIVDATINSDGTGITRALTVLGGSMAIVRGSTITSPNASEVVYIEEASTVEFEDSDVTSGTGADDIAIAAVYGGTVRFRSAGAGGSTIDHPTGGTAVGVIYGSRLVLEEGHDTFNGNMLIANGSVADIKDATINGDVQVENHAILRLRTRVVSSATVVNGNIDIRGDSLLEFKESTGNKVLVNGNINCHDEESHLSNEGQATVTGITSGCSGF